MRFDRFQPGVGWLFLALALIAGAAPAGPPELIVIDADDPVVLERLESVGVVPVRLINGHALAWSQRESAGLIRDLGIVAARLGPRSPDREYSIVFSAGRTPGKVEAPLASLGRVLWEDEHIAILEHAPEIAGRLSSLYEMIPVGDREVRFAEPFRYDSKTTPIDFDEIIAGYVTQVDIAVLREVCETLENFQTRVSTTQGCHRAGTYLEELFQSYGLADVGTFDYRPEWCPNVVAVQPGQESPDEIYVIGGHYDSISQSPGLAPGADDNASGTAAVMEAARIFAPHDFEATIIYIAFGGEEQGLHGSEAWANWARESGLDVRAMLNLDMIGYLPIGEIADLDLITNTPSLDLLNLAHDVAAIYLPDYSLVEGVLTGGSSDHASFWQNGFPAIMFHEDTQYRNPFYHSTQDLVDIGLNDFDFTKKNVQVALGLLATLARPLRIRIDHAPLTDSPVEMDGYLVEARLNSTVPLMQDSLLVRYTVDGGPVFSIPLSSEDNSELYSAKIPRQVPGRAVEYEIYAKDIEGRLSRDPPEAPDTRHSFIVGRVSAYLDDFDEDQGWSVEGDAPVGGWVRAVPVGTGAQPEVDAGGGTTGICFVTENGPPGGGIGDHDVDSGSTILTSPRIDLAGIARADLEYSRWFVDETNPDDSLRVLVSNDDGATWTTLETVGRSAREWVDVSIEGLEKRIPLTSSMRLRFIAEDIGRASLVEAAVDRVIIKVIYPTSAALQSPYSRLTTAWPLPFKDGLTVQCNILGETNIRLHAYDVLGRRVREIADRTLGTGLHTIEWDGRDSRGEQVPTGVYFLRFETDSGPSSKMRVPRLR